MDKNTLKKRLQPNASCEGALYRLCYVRDELDLTKKEKKVLLAAKQYGGKNQTFKSLKELTEITKLGLYAPLDLVTTIRKNFDELYKLACEKRMKTQAAKRKGEISGKERKMHIEKDLKIPEKNFESALYYLYLMRHGLMTSKQKRILHTAKKGQNITFARLKNLTEQDKAGNYSPFNIKQALSTYREELDDIAQGRRRNTKRPSSSEDREKLPLITDYKYPTKTSTSIWTVKKK
jgi:hypothetical protein